MDVRVTPSMESTEQRGTGIENGSEWSNRSDRSNREEWSTSKGGPTFSKLFWLDRTDPFSLRPKFPEVLVEWIAPTEITTLRSKYRFFCSLSMEIVLLTCLGLTKLTISTEIR